MEPRKFDVVVAGEINPDLILNGDVIPQFGQVEKLVEHADLTIGSSSAIFACGAARLGLKTAFIGVCADDVFGQFMLSEMNKHLIDTSQVITFAGGSTGFSVILNTGLDRAILTFPGLIGELKAEDIPDSLLNQTRHLHVGGYFIQESLRPGLADLFDRAHKFGVTTSLDTNYDPTERWEGVMDVLSRTDIFMPNEKEAVSIAHADELSDAMEILAQKCKIVCVKRGAQGATLCSNNNLVRANPLHVNVVDTVGAGDSFDAGFIYGFLNHLDYEINLRIAVVCGALSTRGPGGTSSQADIPLLNAYINN